MKRVVYIFLVVLMYIPAAHAAPPDPGKFTQHYPNSLFEVTGHGLYSVEMLILGNGLKVGKNSVDIIVHDKNDHDVMGAEISVTPWAPEMGHGVMEKPTVTERGGGLYSIENVAVIMAGHWQLKVQVNKGGIEDTAVFDFPDVHQAGAMHQHETVEKAVPEGLNVSHIRLSMTGVFRVAFLSDVMPIPVNKLHGWRIYVETADGKPVTDASISIGGEMPQHGHGMPTKPVVSRNLGGGVYEIEGMKFQMPGWWAVSFTISSDGVSDKVTFNQMLK